MKKCAQCVAKWCALSDKSKIAKDTEQWTGKNDSLHWRNHETKKQKKMLHIASATARRLRCIL
jgi:hypothetical protein